MPIPIKLRPCPLPGEIELRVFILSHVGKSKLIVHLLDGISKLELGRIPLMAFALRTGVDAIRSVLDDLQGGSGGRRLQQQFSQVDF